MVFERIKNGEALYQTKGIWESDGSANSGACFLERSQKNDEVIANIIGRDRLDESDLADGCVVMLTNGGGPDENGMKRSYKGLSILTPELEVVYKSEEPIIFPTPGLIDEAGVEDGRLTLIDDIFYAWYCGYNGKEGRACVAYSKDLIHWEKVAPLQGNINDCQNKDHVIFPEKIRGKYYMLHRPWGELMFGEKYNMPICLAESDSILGEWNDLGILLKPIENPVHNHDWLGGGTPPISIGDGRYLEIYHNAWFEKDGYRQYNASAVVIDFNKGDPSNPSSLITHRLEPILEPSYNFPNEVNKDLRIDIVFPMSCYQRGEDLYLIYGAGDRVTCAAKVNFKELLDELERNKV